MALRVGYKARVLSRHKGALFVCGRHFHQNYHHPKDVPSYQTPTLGDGDFKGNELDESDWDISKMRGGAISYRSDEINWNSEMEGQDHPSWIWAQDPEQFLPEEQGFFEFWGYYPFVFFGGAALVSKEYWLSYHSYPAHAGWVIVPIATTFAMCASDALAQATYRRGQLYHDRDWLGLTLLRESLGKLIGGYENDLKSKERSEKYDTYLEALNRRKVAFFSHQRQKAFAQDLLRRLQIIRQAEETYEKNLKDGIMREAFDDVESRMKTDAEWKKKWNTDMFTALEELSTGKDPSVQDTTSLLFEDFLNSKAKQLQDQVDSPRPLDQATHSVLDVVTKNLSDLRVYDGPKDVPEQFAPRMTGIFGPLSPEQLQALPSGEHLKQQKKKVIESQLARFSKGKEPKALLDRLQTVS